MDNPGPTPDHTLMGTCFAMDHIKAASSLAIAVTTVLRFLPFADQAPESGT